VECIEVYAWDDSRMDDPTRFETVIEAMRRERGRSD